MRKEAEKELTNLSQKPDNIFKLMKFVKINWKDIGGKCWRGKDGMLSFSEKDRKNIEKLHGGDHK